MDLVVYVRTSTASAGNGDSPAAQEDACRAWAAGEGHEVATVHVDRGLSGKLGPDDRPGLAAALVAVEQGDADGVVVHRLDRLARELHVQEAALARAWAAGGRVFEAVEGEVPRDDPDDPYRRFVRQVMGAAAELERGMIAARLRTGRRRKRERGGYTGGPAVRSASGSRVRAGTLGSWPIPRTRPPWPRSCSCVAQALRSPRSPTGSTPKDSHQRGALAGTRRA